RLYRGWNIVSIPVVPSDKRVSSIFPGAIPPAYIYNPITRRYEATDSLEEGKGYYVLSFNERLYEVEGIPVRTYDLVVSRGWNMIGSVSSPTPVPFSSLTSFPSSIIIDPRAYYFNTRLRRYESRTNFIPGEGYFIYASQSGTIRMR
ncbi:MAG: hypothetical protein ACPL6C_01270, partial [bacterium]